jgi:hypothetical protein
LRDTGTWKNINEIGLGKTVCEDVICDGLTSGPKISFCRPTKYNEFPASWENVTWGGLGVQMNSNRIIWQNVLSRCQACKRLQVYMAVIINLL